MTRYSYDIIKGIQLMHASLKFSSNEHELETKLIEIA